MNIDDLIAACMTAEDIGPMTFTPARVLAIRRILEAVREDMAAANLTCKNRRSNHHCFSLHGIPQKCLDCPASLWHAATRAALEV